MDGKTGWEQSVRTTVPDSLTGRQPSHQNQLDDLNQSSVTLLDGVATQMRLAAITNRDKSGGWPRAPHASDHLQTCSGSEHARTKPGGSTPGMRLQATTQAGSGHLLAGSNTGQSHEHAWYGPETVRPSAEYGFMPPAWSQRLAGRPLEAERPSVAPHEVPECTGEPQARGWWPEGRGAPSGTHESVDQLRP